MTKRIIWLTDLHLNFITWSELDTFCRDLLSPVPDLILIGGDISDSRSLMADLSILEEKLQTPLYFVLGNHDFYHSSITEVRKQVAELTRKSSHLHWLPQEGVVELTESVALLGHDSWADGRFGDYANSTLELNDYVLIREFIGLNRGDRLRLLQKLGDEAA